MARFFAVLLSVFMLSCLPGVHTTYDTYRGSYTRSYPYAEKYVYKLQLRGSTSSIVNGVLIVQLVIHNPTNKVMDLRGVCKIYEHDTAYNFASEYYMGKTTTQWFKAKPRSSTLMQRIIFPVEIYNMSRTKYVGARCKVQSIDNWH